MDDWLPLSTSAANDKNFLQLSRCHFPVSGCCCMLLLNEKLYVVIYIFIFENAMNHFRQTTATFVIQTTWIIPNERTVLIARLVRWIYELRRVSSAEAVSPETKLAALNAPPGSGPRQISNHNTRLHKPSGTSCC